MQVHYFCANKIASSARVLNICPFAAKVAAILHTDARLRWTNLRNTSHESCHAHPPRGSFLPCLAASFVPNLMPRSTTLLGAPQDYRKITVEKRGVDEKDFFTSQNVRECMAKVHSSPLRTMETVQTNTETVRRVMESQNRNRRVHSLELGPCGNGVCGAVKTVCVGLSGDGVQVIPCSLEETVVIEPDFEVGLTREGGREEGRKGGSG
eukprot:784665-Rhodomonas_salina.1